ncbi:hypothetical protein QE386_001635 [Pseudoxanthomonas winnipegensis]|nr:hypothetical protein [Pseudoxanthomonas winnipegensis]MDQ1133040.1 hypothetical protein [Pseudoxanthomonas winnipegensis]
MSGSTTGRVERMGHGAHQRARGLQRQLGIGIQGDDIAHPAQRLGAPDDAAERRGVALAQQRVERGQLAALALQAHPAALVRIPLARAVEQVEQLAFGRIAALSVAGVERGDARLGMGQHGRVLRQVFLRGIGEVGQQAEVQMRPAVGQEPHLQRIDQFIDRLGVGDHRGHDHQRARLRRDAGLVIQAGQRMRRRQVARGPVDQRHAQLAEGQQRQHRRAGHPAPGRHGGGQGAGQQAGGEQRGEHRDRPDIGQQRHRPHIGQQPAPAAAGQGARDLARAVAQQPPADVAVALGRTGRGRARAFQHHRGDLAFRPPGAPGHGLDHPPVLVAAGEVHGRIGAVRVLAQQVFDHAAALDEAAPVHAGDEAQAADAVADRGLRGGLANALALDHGLERAPALGHPLLHPVDRHVRGEVAAAQVAQQFGHEGPAHRRLRAQHVGQHQHHVLGRALGGFGHALGPGLGQAVIADVAGDARGDAAQVLDHRQAQHDRHGPQLADAQRLLLLVAADQPLHGLGIDLAIAVGHRLHGQVVDPRQAGRRPAGQRRQRPAVAAGQVAPRQPHLLVDQVVVVQQPFAGRHHRQLVAGEGVQGLDRALEHRAVFGQPRQHPLRALPGLQRVLLGQAPAQLFHLGGVEQLGAQRRLGCGGADRVAVALPPTRQQPPQDPPAPPPPPCTHLTSR